MSTERERKDSGSPYLILDCPRKRPLPRLGLITVQPLQQLGGLRVPARQCGNGIGGKAQGWDGCLEHQFIDSTALIMPHCTSEAGHGDHLAKEGRWLKFAISRSEDRNGLLPQGRLSGHLSPHGSQQKPGPFSDCSASIQEGIVLSFTQ